MRIFFCGAQGVGKSTLVRELSKHFPSHIVHDSMSALFMKEKSEQFTEEFQNKVNVYCFNIFLNSGDNIIMSRSIIDSLALNKKGLSRDYIESLVPHAVRETDYYFYLPIEFEISEREDGLRYTSKVYQREIDDVMEAWFSRFPSKKKYEIRGDVQSRVNKILDIIYINERSTVKK